MIAAAIAFIGPTTGVYDTLIESGEVHAHNNDQDGADFSTFIDAGRYHYLLQSNSFEGTTYIGPPGSRETWIENDDGAAYYATEPLLTSFFYSGNGEAFKSNSDGKLTQSHSLYESGYGLAQVNVDGDGSFWNINNFGYTVGFTDSAGFTDNTDGTSFTTNFIFESHFNFDTTAGSPPGFGIQPNLTTVATTFNFPVAILSEASDTRTVPTGTLIFSGTNTITTTTSATLSDATRVQGSASNIVATRATLTDYSYFDPYNVYQTMVIYIPETNLTVNDWMWYFNQGGGLVGTSLFTDIYHSIDGELVVIPQAEYPIKILSVFDASTPEQTYYPTRTTSYTTGGGTDTGILPTYQFDILTFQTSAQVDTNGTTTRNAFDGTSTVYFAGSLPMDSSTFPFSWQNTVFSTSDAGGVQSTFTSSAFLAIKYTSDFVVLYSYQPIIFSYIDNNFRQTTASYLNVFSVTAPGGVKPIDDGDFIETAYFSTTFGPTDGNDWEFEADYEGQTITGVFPGTGNLITPISTINTYQVWPFYYHQIGLQIFSPAVLSGFQIQPSIRALDPVFQAVSVDNSISVFPDFFFNYAFIGYNNRTVGVPYQFYYQDFTRGITGVSAVDDYTFKFVTETNPVDPWQIGNILVTHSNTDESTATTFAASLFGGGNVIPLEIAMKTSPGYPIAGGLPRAGPLAGAGDTVQLYGVYRTTDELKATGIDTFLYTFEMATDELSAFESTTAYQLSTQVIYGLVGADVRVFPKFPFGP